MLLDWAPSVDEGACQYESSTAVCQAYPSTAAGTCYEAAVRGDQQLWPSVTAHLVQHHKISACLCLLTAITYMHTEYMLNFQASVSGNGQRFSVSQMRLWHSPCQHTPLGCNLVSHVSACWLTGLGLGTPSRYLARTISWNACKLL